MTDNDIAALIERLWHIPRPGPDNLMSAPAFVALSELCSTRYGVGKPKFALSTALRSLGLPCQLPAKQAALALDPQSAVAVLDAAFRAKMAVRRYICPLDLADTLPPLRFGNARVMRFTADELAALFDAPRLARTFPSTPLEAKRLAEFQWLVIEENIDLNSNPEARSVPWMFEDMRRDLGEIDPHHGRFPGAVEASLAFLLLAPWEVWSTMLEVDWRGFKIPWIYALTDDLFVRPERPPRADSLAWQPYFVPDGLGGEIEDEEPTTMPLEDGAASELALFNDTAWQEFVAASASPLFETPIVHFLVRAFAADGMDEVMAHMTLIEAAVGLQADHRWKAKSDAHKTLGATQRVKARIAALLGDVQAAIDYGDLFELRSAYVHGRGGLSKVSTQEQVRARGLARRVTSALVGLSAHRCRPRDEVLAELLDRGAPMLPASPGP